MKTANEIANQFIKMAAERMIREDSDEWPPECLFITYQPERPAHHTASENKE